MIEAPSILCSCAEQADSAVKIEVMTNKLSEAEFIDLLFRVEHNSFNVTFPLTSNTASMPPERDLCLQAAVKAKRGQYE